MKIREIRALRGANYFSRHKSIYMELDIGDLEDRPTDELEGFNERLKELIPSLVEHRCSVGTRGGFFERLERGTWAGHVVEHIAIELQCLAKIEVGFGKTIGMAEKGVYQVVYRYRDEEAGILAGRYAVEVVESLIEGKPVDLKEKILDLKHARERNLLGPSTQSIVDKANRRGIPVIRLNSDSYVQLGYGKNQRRIQATMTDTTSAIGVEIADDKNRTKEILTDARIPVPRGWEVDDIKEALQAAEEIGYPVVVKPVIGNHGRGITTNILDQEELRESFNSAKKVHDSVIIERFVDGFDYRVLVINGRFIAAAKRVPPFITGDGNNSIRDLIDTVNQDPLRGFGHEKVLTRIEIDYMTKRLLRQKGMKLDDILPDGEILYLKTTANLSSGGTAEDVTGDVHPLVRNMAERISRIVDLDVMGIDIIAPTLSEPLSETGGGIVEVNAAPGLRMHLKPSRGKGRDVSSPVVDMLFPPGSEARIPIIAVTGTNGKTTTVRLISHIMKYDGKTVGTSCSDGIIINNELLEEGDYSGPEGTRFVLKDPTVDCAVLEVARGSIIRRGLAYDGSDIGVLLNISRDHLGEGGIVELEDLARLKGTIVETVCENGHAILNADDPLVMGLKDGLGCNIILFSLDPDNPVLREHLESGGKVVTINDDTIILREEGFDLEVAQIQDIPITLGGKAAFNVQNALAATAATSAAGVSPNTIDAGLVTFNPTFGQLPGRMNIIDIGPIKVVVDYGHNTPAVKSFSTILPYLNPGKKINVAHGTGNRRDEDILEFGRTIGDVYDHIIIFDADTRNREPGELARMVRKGIMSSENPPGTCEIIVDESEAIRHALSIAENGDLVVVQACDVMGDIRLINQIKDEALQVMAGNAGKGYQ